MHYALEAYTTRAPFDTLIWPCVAFRVLWFNPAANWRRWQAQHISPSIPRGSIRLNHRQHINQNKTFDQWLKSKKQR